jgi:hypothetical protein
MKRMSRRITHIAMIAAVVATLVVNPAFAAAKNAEKRSFFESIVRKIVHMLDEIHISLPPG